MHHFRMKQDLVIFGNVNRKLISCNLPFQNLESYVLYSGGISYMVITMICSVEPNLDIPINCGYLEGRTILTLII